MEAARRAADVALLKQAGVVAETKLDGSPVTEADKECERLIAAMLSEAFPDDGVLGEEGSRKDSRNGRRWILDPIDGTRDYVRGNPLWANLIGLESGDRIVAGVANLPGLGSMYWATAGSGAYRDGSRLQASGNTDFSDSVFCLNGLNNLQRLPFRDNLAGVMARFWAVRCLGGAPDAMLVASGQADVWIEPNAAPWDLAPIRVIAEEAGARFFTFQGSAGIYDGNCVVCAPGLEAGMRGLLRSC